MAAFCGTCSGQWLHSVQVDALAPVRTGDTATFTCSFTGSNITVQYITWTKISKEGRRKFVYEYSEHPPIRKSYNDFRMRTSVGDRLQGSREESRVALERVLSKRPHRRRNTRPVYEEMSLHNQEDSLMSAWKMPQNDYVDPPEVQYIDPPDPVPRVIVKDNLLISDEVQKDLQHSAAQILEKREKNQTVSLDAGDMNPEPKKAEFPQTSNLKEFQPIVTETKQHTLTEIPVLKLDVSTPDLHHNTSAVTMAMTPVSGAEPEMVTMATNQGQQVPVDHSNGVNVANVLSYEYPRDREQSEDEARRLLHRNPQFNIKYENTRENVHVVAGGHVAKKTDTNGDDPDSMGLDHGNIFLNDAPRSKIVVKNSQDVNPPEVVTSSNEVTSNFVPRLPPPVKDSKWTVLAPTKQSPPPPPASRKEIKAKPTPLFKPRNAFRRMYFSRNTPDLRFKRDLSRAMRSSLRTVDHMSLHLHRVNLEDEAMYECQVKPLGGPARWGRAQLNVHVMPGPPVIDAPAGPFQEKSNATVECRGNVGKPAGTLTWYRKRMGQEAPSHLTDLPIETKVYSLSNGSNVAVSKLNIAFTEYDDGAVLQCVATSTIMAAQESKPRAQLTLSVQYAPREGRILFDTALGRYYCHARGNPAPTYAWLWMRPDGRQTIMSSDRYLDLKGMRRSGYYRFHCLASNVIHGVRHTKVMATKLRVIAPETTTTSTTTTTEAPTTTTTTTTTSTTTTTTPRPTTTAELPFDDPDTTYDATQQFKSSSRPHGYISRLDVMRAREQRFKQTKQQQKQQQQNHHYQQQRRHQPPQQQKQQQQQLSYDSNEDELEDEDYYYEDEDYADEDDAELNTKLKNDEYLEKEITVDSEKEEDLSTDSETVKRTYDGEFDCSKRADGAYGAGCRAFYRCTRRKAYFVECKQPYVFSKNTQKCEKPDLAPAPCGIWRDCSRRASRKFADTDRGCMYYYTCWHGYFMGHNECNPGLVFNERVQLCDWPDNVAMPCGKAPPPRRIKTRRRRIKKGPKSKKN